ncbi:uncharacterized protein LOC116179532 [Photinus pyralis]|nr:uncharacterized protein LOC116179532 [Photinus pyralis]
MANEEFVRTLNMAIGLVRTIRVHLTIWVKNKFLLQSDDYISLRVGGVPALDDSVIALLAGNHAPPVIPIPVEDKSQPAKPHMVTENQLPIFPSNMTPTDGHWQIVNGTKFKFFVFSAYFDRRKGQRAVRIVAATKTRGAERVWCRLWYRPFTTESNSTSYISRTVPAKIKVIRENWNLKYSACFVLCPLQANQTAPFAVSVVVRLLSPPANLLTVNDNYNDTKATNKFGVCIKPLHYEYNGALQILEFIELNRIMGVSHFTFYNHTIGPQVRCILKHYMERGLVTLLPWQLNMVSQKEIRTEGLFAALNDCLYRSMYRFSHILLIDLDEYIIPSHNHTLPQLLDFLSTKMSTRTTGSYSFQNAFFYLQWGDDDWVYNSNDPIAINLVTLKKTRRKSKLHPHKQRSKYICKPEFVVEAGNHFVWEFIPGHGTYNVPADAAILHHYRICEFGGDDCIKTASTVDQTAFRYRKSLVSAVKNSYEFFKDTCGLRDLTPPTTNSRFLKILRDNIKKIKSNTR